MSTERNPQNKDVIFLVGAQRTGSNYLLSALKSVDDISVYGELFHRNGPYPFKENTESDETWRWRVLSHFFETRSHLLSNLKLQTPGEIAALLEKHSSGAPLTNPAHTSLRNKTLSQIAHQMPFAYISSIREISECRTIIFKAFPEHLNTSELHNLIKSLRPIIVYNLRNTLDMFVSYQKLKKTKLPQGEDTTSIKVRFAIQDYVQFLVETRSFFFAVRDFSNYFGLEQHTISYEDIHIHQTDSEKVRFISDQLAHWTGRNWHVNESRIKTFRRQDQSKSNADKVLNSEELPMQPATIF